MNVSHEVESYQHLNFLLQYIWVHGTSTTHFKRSTQHLEF